MVEPFDLLLRGGTLITHNGIGRGDVGVRDGRITAIGDMAPAAAGEVFDATGLHVLPGVIDTQVHFREPGREHKENLEAGSRGAVLGGVTAVFEMPNTSPLPPLRTLWLTSWPEPRIACCASMPFMLAALKRTLRS